MNRDKIEKVLYRLILGGIFLIPIAPLIVIPQMIAPDVVPRTLYFRTIIEVIFAAWLILNCITSKYRPHRSLILGSVGLFIAAIGTSDILGISPLQSILGDFGRMEGWILLAHLFLYVTMISTVIKSPNTWKWFWNLTLIVAAIVSAIGFLQFFGILDLPREVSSGRITSTFQTASYLAGYLLFHIFIGVMILYKEFEAKKVVFLNVYFYSFIAATSTLALFLTGTRGTILGLLVGTITTYSLITFFYPAFRTRKMLLILSIGVIGAASIFFLLIKTSTFVQDIGSLNRIASISLKDSTIQSRIINWRIAWDGVQERPFLGWGQESYSVVYNKHYDPRLLGQDQYDRVHNIVLEWLIAGGIIGLLSYLSVFGFTLLTLWRQTRFDSAEKAILTGLLAGYFTHNLSLFDDLMSYVFFMTVLAYIIWGSSPIEREFPEKSLWLPKKQFIPLITSIVLVVLAICVTKLNIETAHAAVKLKRGLAIEYGITDRNIQDILAVAENGLFGAKEAYPLLAEMSLQIAQHPEADINRSVIQSFYTEAVKGLDSLALRYPFDAKYYITLGRLHFAYGAKDKALESLRSAAQLAPSRQDIPLMMADITFSQNDLNAALGYLRQAFEIYPANSNARISYATIAILTENYDLSDTLLLPLLDNGELTDPRVVRAYAEKGQGDKLLAIASSRIDHFPDDPWGYLLGALAHCAANQDSAAIQLLKTGIVKENDKEHVSIINDVINSIEKNSHSKEEILKTLSALVKL